MLTRRECESESAVANRCGVGLLGCVLVWTGDGRELAAVPRADGTGISSEKGVPTSWSQGDYLWDVAIEGIGHASPVVWGNDIFVTSAEDNGAIRRLVCLDAQNGKQRLVARDRDESLCARKSQEQ